MNGMERPYLEIMARLSGPVRLALEICLVVLVGFLAARLVWLVAAPQHAVSPFAVRALPMMLAGESAALQVNRALLVEMNPFSTSAVVAEAPIDAPETQLNLRLDGLRMSSADAGGFAVIQGPNGLAESFAIGEEILPGVVLDRILSDRVILSRAGVQETLLRSGRGEGLSVIGDSQMVPQPPGVLAAPSTQQQAGTSASNLPAGAGQSGPVAAQTPSSVSADGVVRFADPDVLIRGIVATPKLRGGQVFGVELRAAAGSDVMAQAGLRDGDVLLTINGEGVGSMSPGQMASRIGAERQAELVVDRGGRTQTVMIEFNE